MTPAPDATAATRILTSVGEEDILDRQPAISDTGEVLDVPDAGPDVPDDAWTQRLVELCHEVNRDYCILMLQEYSQVPWLYVSQEQRDLVSQGVRFALAGRRTPAEMHMNWMARKRAEGWTYGPVKDETLKHHPCVVDRYEDLPLAQRRKDALFLAVIHAMTTPMP